MRKILLSLVFLSLTFIANAQNSDDALAKQLVNTNAAAIGLSQNDLNNYFVSSSYFNKTGGEQLVYLLQGYKGLPVWNQMLVLAFKDGKLISKAGNFLDNLDSRTGFGSPVPSRTPADAVKSAITDSKLAVPASLSVKNTLVNGKKYDFGKLNNLTAENVIAELMWVPVMENGKITSVKLAWEVQLYLEKKADYWNIRVDANNNQVIDKNDLTVSENFDQFKPTTNLRTPDEINFMKNLAELQKFTSPTNNLNADFFKSPNILNSPSLVATANYTVIPWPVESPLYGPAALRTNPWTLAGGNAVSLEWHNDGAVDYTISRGNNVHAHEDQANNNSNNGIVATSTTTPDPLNFTYAGQPNYTVQPTTPLFQQFAITNLFYWNNIVHDATYKYGFDEPAGNFENNNQGRGGLGSDYVQADAQDGGGTNNANFATPIDGQKPRMQMYLFSPAPATINMVVNTPPAIAGPYNAVEGQFSTANLLINVGPKTGQVVYYNDDAGGTTHFGCAAPANSITGKIALIIRGGVPAACAFTVKVHNAQDAGAIAVIMVNNVPGAPIIMGGGPDPTIIIPAVMISDVDGATIAAQLANNVNVTLSATGGGSVNLDGDIDNGVITHEYFHGVSNRLTGGPANSSCLNNAEEGGEGWSDYNALMLTTDWSTAVATDGNNHPRPIGNYVIGQTQAGGGIRNYPYCTNIAINPLTYANMGVAPIGTEVHNIGEIWCMACWEMTWALIQTDGINPNLWNNAAAGGNSVAYKLVIEGLKLQPCSPGYIDARNAILQADQNLYGGIHYCTIYSAFAKRGMGFGASEGSSNSATDQTPSFALPPGTTFTTQPANSTACNGTATSFTVVAAGGGTLTYQWQLSTAGVGGPWVSVPVGAPYTGINTATLNINPVANSMNGYAYRCIVTSLCGPGTSNAAVLTVIAAAIGGTVTPANTSVCVVPNSTTLTLSGNVGPVNHWESSTVGAAGPYGAPIANTTNTLVATNVAVTTWFRAVIQAAGCTSANSSAAQITVLGGALPMSIISDVPTTLCAGNPATLTAVEGSSAPVAVTVNQSSSNAITTGNSVSCGTAGVNTAVNSFWRAYNLTAFPAVTGNYTINSVTFGVEQSTGGPQTVIVNLYNQTGAAFPGGTRTLLTTQTYSVPNLANALFVATFTTPITVPNSSTIIVEVQKSVVVTNQFFYIGSNAAAEAGPSYLSAAACGIVNPTTMAAIGFPNMHIVEFLNGTVPGTGGTIVTGGTFLWSPAAGLNSTITNPVAASPAVTTTYTVTHNNGAGCIRTASITLTVNQRPVVTVQPVNKTTCASTSTSFSITATGAGLTYQWQVSTNNGVTYTDIPVGAPYGGTTTATLTINPVTVAMNGFRYRCVVSGTCPPGLGTPNISNGAILTVNGTPTITVGPNNQCGPVTLTATGALTYTWSPAAGLNVTTGPVVIANPTVNTVYTVTGTNAAGCTGSATVTVNYTPAAPIVNPVSATMCLGDAAVPLTITSSLAPSTVSFTNSTPIAVPDNTPTATTSTIAIAGIPANATISSMSVTLNMSHTYPGDMIFNLKAPNGNILNLYKFNSDQDTGPLGGVPTWGWFGAVISSTGTVPFTSVATAPFTYNTPPIWKPDAWNAPITTYPFANPTGFVSNAPNFAALYSTPNGTWTLAMADGGPGDVGTLTSWTISITYGLPSTGIWTPNGAGSGLFLDAAATIPYIGTSVQTVYAKPAVSTTYSVVVNTGQCNSLPTLVPVTVNNPVVITAQPNAATVCTDKTISFSVSVTGTSPTYQWQVSTTAGGSTFVNITNGGVYSGATTATLTLTAPPVALNGFLYRVIVNGASPCGSATSQSRLLTVNPLPTVVISGSPLKLFPGIKTTLSFTSNPTAVTQTWFRNGVAIATTLTYVVDIDHLGDYSVTVTDVNGCVNSSNHLLISDSLTSRVFIYPNPNGGVFFVRYDPNHTSVTPFGLNIYDAIGKRIYSQTYPLGAPYAAMKVDMSNFSTGMYSVEVTDVDGNRLGIGRVEIVR